MMGVTAPQPAANTQLALLLDLLEQINRASLDLESTLQAITEAAAVLTSTTASSIYLRDQAGLYRVEAAYGISREALRDIVLSPSVGLLAQLCATQQPAQVTDYAHQVLPAPHAREAVDQMGIHAVLAIPILRHGEVIGALYVSGPQSIPFGPETVEIMQRLASFAQVAMHNAQRFSDLAEERTRLQAYLDAIPEGVMVFDRDGELVLLNDTLRSELGFSGPLEEIDQEGVWSHFQRYSSRLVRFRYDPVEAFRRVQETGEAEQFLLETEEPFRRYEVHLRPLHADLAGFEGYVASTRDITSPLELERERERSHLLAQLVDLSVQLNSNQSVPQLMERVVEAATQLVGARGGTAGLIEGDRLIFPRMRVDDQWIDHQIETERGVGVSGHVWETLEPYVCNDSDHDPYVLTELRDRVRYQRLIVVPILNRSGQMIGTLEAIDPLIERDFGTSDVETLQLLAYQASTAIENARLAQLKDEFLSIVSHELKTPVTSIKGFTQILQRRLPVEVFSHYGHYLDVINKSADRLTRLINDLLDLSRIQRGRLQFDVSPLDYRTFMEQVVADMQLVTPHNPIKLEIPERMEVAGNADRLRQVMVNLIDNAAKYGPEGSDITVTVEHSNGEVVTYVCDEGPGLPPGEEDKVFGPYYQIGQGSGSFGMGLGLGLFVSRQIVEGHRGRIWLDRNDHTSFCFSLPPGD